MNCHKKALPSFKVGLSASNNLIKKILHILVDFISTQANNQDQPWQTISRRESTILPFFFFFANFSTSSPILGSIIFLNFSYSKRCVVVSHAFNLACYFLIITHVEHLFIVSCLIFGEMSVQIFWPFNTVYSLSTYSVLKSSLSHKIFANIF